MSLKIEFLRLGMKAECYFFLLTAHFPVLSSQIVLYLRMCLAHSAGATPMSSRLGDMQDDAPAIGRYVHTLLSSESQPSVSKGLEANPVHVYMDLLQQLLSAVGGERSQTCFIVGTNIYRMKSGLNC